eukprot:gene1607-12732_t
MVFIQQKDVGKLSSTFETHMIDDTKSSKKKALRNPYFEVQKVKSAYKGLHKKPFRIIFDRNGLKTLVPPDAMQAFFQYPVSKIASDSTEDKILLDWFYLEKYMIPIFKLSIKNDKNLPAWVFEEITVKDMKLYYDKLNETLGNFKQRKRIKSPRLLPGTEPEGFDEDDALGSSFMLSRNLHKVDAGPRALSKSSSLKKLNLKLESDSDLETVPASPIVTTLSSPEVQKEEKKEVATASLSDLKLPKDWTKKLTESNKLGEGGFGAVYELLTGTGKMVAVKEMSVDRSDKDALEETMSELVLKDLKHENILEYLGLYEGFSKIYLFTEKCSNGSLQSLIKKQGGLLLPVLQTYAIQILKGMNYLHEKKIIHRDIKPGNLLLDNNFTIKIADFGLALAKNEDENSGGGVQGTPLYMSPELIKEGQYSVASDVWAFGLTIMEMYTASIPRLDEIKGLTGVKVFEQLSNNKPNLPKNLPNELDEFLKLCFAWNPEDRANTVELLQHPFLTTVFEDDDVFELSSVSKSFYNGTPSQQTSNRTGKSSGAIDFTDSIFDGDILDDEYEEDYFGDEYEEEEEEEEPQHEDVSKIEKQTKEKKENDYLNVLMPNQNRNSVAMRQSIIEREREEQQRKDSHEEQQKISEEILKAQELLKKERDKLEQEKKLVQLASQNLKNKQTKMKEEEALRKKKKNAPKGLVGLFTKKVKKKIQTSSQMETDQSDFKLDQMKSVPSSNLPDE